MESLEFLPAYSDCKRFFVTFERSQAKDLLKNEKVYFVTDPKRNPIKLLQNLNQAINILKKENPDVVISTGAAAAVPICYAAKMFGKKIIFIETIAAVDKPSLSGRAIYPIADLFVIQWKNLKKYYERAFYGGPLV